MIVFLLLLGYYTSGKRDFGKSHPQVIIHRHKCTVNLSPFTHFSSPYLHIFHLHIYTFFISIFPWFPVFPYLQFLYFLLTHYFLLSNFPIFPSFRLLIFFYSSILLWSRLLPCSRLNFASYFACLSVALFPLLCLLEFFLFVFGLLQILLLICLCRFWFVTNTHSGLLFAFCYRYSLPFVSFLFFLYFQLLFSSRFLSFFLYSPPLLVVTSLAYC